MSTNTLTTLSEHMAEAVAAIGPSVVQVHGRRRPISGVAYTSRTILTIARALGRDDGVRVTTGNGRTAAAELAGWDPASGLAVLRVDAVELTPAKVADSAARVGQIALAAARSWSNALTASAGVVAVIGGPLRTGRGHALEQIIRVTAPMHDGFAGGAVIDAAGGVIGIATAAQIRGFAVVIPAGIAWKRAAHVLEHGRPTMGFPANSTSSNSWRRGYRTSPSRRVSASAIRRSSSTWPRSAENSGPSTERMPRVERCDRA